MQIDLANRTALVTGSTSGIGYAIAKALAVAGARVAVHGQSEATVSAARERLQRDVPGSDIVGHKAPLEDPDAVQGLIEALPEVDILVSNAGPTRSTSLFDMDLSEWHAWLDTYITAGMLLGRHHLAGMMNRDWGRILFSGGITCSYTPADPSLDEMTTWLTCKAAMLGLSRSLAEIATGRRVTINAFIPGPAMSEERYESSPYAAEMPFGRFEREYFAGPGSSSLLQRFVEPDEIANLAVFLASDQASGITGSTFRVDGGIIRSIL